MFMSQLAKMETENKGSLAPSRGEITAVGFCPFAVLLQAACGDGVLLQHGWGPCGVPLRSTYVSNQTFSF